MVDKSLSLHDAIVQYVHVGMKEENLNEAINLILAKAPNDNARPVDETGIRAILENAYVGQRPGPERSL